MKLSAKTLAEDIKKVELSAELQKFYDENVKKMVDLYGEDETIDELINKFVEKANAYLDKNAKKAEPKPEPKEEESVDYVKYVVGADDESVSKEFDTEKEAQKYAQSLIKKGVKGVFMGKSLRSKKATSLLVGSQLKLRKSQKQSRSQRKSQKPKPAEPKPEPKAEEKPKTELKAEEKPKKEPEGEPVAKISPEVAIIKRFVNCCKGDKGRETARKILAALQKHIVNKEIRKTSNYAAEIMHIQKALITIVYGKKKPDFDKAEFERLEKIAEAEYQEPVAKLSRSFISLIGKEGVKEKAKSLLKKFKDADVSNPLVAEMIKSLQDYVSGNAETVETTARSLQGIFGLAGI